MKMDLNERLRRCEKASNALEKRIRVRKHTRHTRNGVVPVSEHTRLTKKKLNYFIEDEKKAIKEYNKAGLPNLAHDEAGHLAFLKRLKRGNR